MDKNIDYKVSESQTDKLLREILVELKTMNDRNRVIANAIPVLFSNMVTRGDL